MIVYHGSNVIVEHPDNLHSQEHLDFGMGFYTTTVQLQAERWAKQNSIDSLLTFRESYEVKI